MTLVPSRLSDCWFFLEGTCAFRSFSWTFVSCDFSAEPDVTIFLGLMSVLWHNAFVTPWSVVFVLTPVQVVRRLQSKVCVCVSGHCVPTHVRLQSRWI